MEIDMPEITSHCYHQETLVVAHSDNSLRFYEVPNQQNSSELCLKFATNFDKDIHISDIVLESNIMFVACRETNKS